MGDWKGMEMTQIKIIGFVDVHDKPEGADSMTHFRHEDFIIIDYNKLFDPAWKEGIRTIARSKGYYPSKKRGSVDGGRFDLVYVCIDELPPHKIGERV